MDVALDHDTCDGRLSLGNLLSDAMSDLDLVLVFLLRVAVAAIDHQPRVQLLGLELLARLFDARRVVVCALLAATHDDESIVVASSADNSDNTGLGDGEEMVGVLDGAQGVHGNIKGAVCAVLEADGERQTGGKLAVELGLGGAGANGSHAQHVGQELGRNGVEHFAGDGHAFVSQVDEQLSRHAQALVDLERVVDIRVVDQALPSDGGPGLFQVCAHDDEQVVLVLLLELQQAVAVLEGSLGVVDGAGADDDHQAALVIATVNDVSCFIAGLDGGLFGTGRLGDLVLEQVGRGQRVVAADAPVL